MDPPIADDDGTDDDSSSVNSADDTDQHRVISDGDDDASSSQSEGKSHREHDLSEHETSHRKAAVDLQEDKNSLETGEDSKHEDHENVVANHGTSTAVAGDSSFRLLYQPPAFQPAPFPYPPPYNAYDPHHYVHPQHFFNPHFSLPHPPPMQQVPQHCPPPSMPPMLPDGSLNNAAAAMMAQAYHEQAARMRDHAAAYASAAASAAWVAAQIANAAAEFVSSAGAAASCNDNIANDTQLNNASTSNNNHFNWTQQPVAFGNPHLPSMFPPHHGMLPSVQPQPQSSPYMAAVSTQRSGLWWENFNNNPDLGATSHNCDLGSHENNRSRHLGQYAEREERMAPGTDGQNHSRKMKVYVNHVKDDNGVQKFNRYCRKRQQRVMMPEESSIPREIAQQGLQQQQRGKIRRRLRSDGDSSTTSSGSSFMPHGNSSTSNNNTLRRSSGYHHNKKKARSDESLLGKTAVAALFEWCSKRQITPNFVLEQPSPEEFDYLVYLDESGEENTRSLDQRKDSDNNIGENEIGAEWGRGRGRSKVAAKQEAARRALQVLIPGVVFDEDTGILIELPPRTVSSSTTNASAVGCSRNDTTNCLDDLAPNLAKQLAIGRDNGTDKTSTITNNNHKHYQQSKRSLDVYPGTSTTSEDEDENTYYTSRGASVCSVLLHAMIQIDTARIPEAPSFTYQVGPPAPLLKNNEQSSGQLRRKTSSGKPLPAGRATRGSFTCTARLKIRDLKPNEEESWNEPAETTITGVDSNLPLDSTELPASVPPINDENQADSTPGTDHSESVLEAVGVGGTKRESRHIASAKLLALLFPDCKDMVEVKAAAEAMRERYAASKVLKQQLSHSSVRHPEGSCDADSDGKTVGMTSQKKVTVQRPFFALAKPSDPPIPTQLEDRIRQIVGSFRMASCEICLEEKKSLAADVDDADKSHCDHRNSGSSAAVFRQYSRQKQLDYRVEYALQMLNDRDEEGRSLPEELTADDVGRLVLRRAEPEDLSRIKKLKFVSASVQVRRGSNKQGMDSPSFVPFVPSESKKLCTGSFLLPRSGSLGNEESLVDNQDLVSKLWTSSSIVLLLCRAIAAFEDPPLGCAVLTPGFSVEKGCFLRLLQIASEHHLPTERFLECLQNFAACMKCGLETQSCVIEQDETVVNLSQDDINAIIASHIDMDSVTSMNMKLSTDTTDSGVTNNNNNESTRKNSELIEAGFNGASSSKLQSVQEESEVSDSSSNDKRLVKRASKPSKRSRFQ